MEGVNTGHARLTPDSEQNIEALHRALRRGSGFGLYVVSGYEGARTEAVRRMLAWSGRDQVPVIERFPAARLREAASKQGVFVDDIMSLPDTERQDFWIAVNLARDVIARRIQGPLVLSLSPDGAREMADKAPDLFSVRTALYEIEEVPPDKLPPPPPEPVRLWLNAPFGSIEQVHAAAARLSKQENQAPPAPAGALADAWLVVADGFRQLDDTGEALEATHNGLRLARSIGYERGVARATEKLGDIAGDHSDHKTARERYEEALALYRGLRDVAGEAGCILDLAHMAHARSEDVTAGTLYQQALALYRGIGSVPGEASCLLGLGKIAASSDQEMARARYEEARGLYRSINDVLGEANCLLGLAEIARDRSDYDEAQALCEEALSLSRKGKVLR
jgi:tetratricopeptide (TPR) repeat protein